jgi:uncharacterized membrane protein YkvA (DUF1232 family)
MARRKLGQLDFGVIDRLRLGWRLLRDPRVSFVPKLLVPLGLIYIISPFDALPDFLPLIGQVDDVSVIGLLLAVIAALVRWAPQHIVAEHAVRLGIIPDYDGVVTERGASSRSERREQEPIEATYWVDDWR